MTEKELKHLNRKELLSIMLEQSKEIDRLNEELAQAKEMLERKEILCSNAGSLAEASLQLNGVFEAAQAAADQYLCSIRTIVEKIHADSEKKNTAGENNDERDSTEGE